MRIAVLMLNLGGPSKLDEVKPFLKNLFADREIIRFPGGAIGQRFFAWLISTTKSPASRRNYAQIGGGTPLLRWTEAQGRGMQELVEREFGVEILPLPCMRYWHPRSDAALKSAIEWGADHIVAFSQYPHESTTTSGSSLRELRRTAARLGVQAPISEITGWHTAPGYITAMAETVREAIAAVPVERRDDLTILYSAHSLPLKFVEEGDPYPDQIRESVELIHAAAGLGLPHELAWQSKVGPIPWLEPSTIDRVRALPGEGRRDLVVVPVSFVNDHIETLQELDIELRKEADEASIRTFVRAPGLNARPAFLRALADVLGQHLCQAGLTAKETVS